MYSCVAAHWHSRILGFYSSALARKPLKIRVRRAGFQPSGPGNTFVFPLEGRRFQPRVGGPGEGPTWAPLGCPIVCPGESSKFSILISPSSNGPVRLSRPFQNCTVGICSSVTPRLQRAEKVNQKLKDQQKKAIEKLKSKTDKLKVTTLIVQKQKKQLADKEKELKEVKREQCQIHVPSPTDRRGKSLVTALPRGGGSGLTKVVGRLRPGPAGVSLHLICRLPLNTAWPRFPAKGRGQMCKAPLT